MTINNLNRDFIIERYVDDLVGEMDFLEIKRQLKEFILQKKDRLPNDTLEIEISQRDPGLLSHYHSEEVFREVYYG